MSFITYLYIFHFIYLYIFIIHLAKLSTREDFFGQNVRGQTVLAKLSVAKLSYIPEGLTVGLHWYLDATIFKVQSPQIRFPMSILQT